MKSKYNPLLPLLLLTGVTGFFVTTQNLHAGTERSAYIELCESAELDPVDRPLLEAIKDLAQTTDCPESDLWLSRQTGLDLSNRSLESLRGLTGLTNLRDLWLQGNRIRDIAPLITLPTLRKLSLENNLLKDTRAIQNIPGLRVVWLERNRLSGPEISQLESALPRASVIAGQQQKLSEFCKDSRNSESETFWCELLKFHFEVKTADELENKTDVEKIGIEMYFFSFRKFKKEQYSLRLGDFHYFPKLRELKIYARPPSYQPTPKERIHLTTDGLHDLPELKWLNLQSVIPTAVADPRASPRNPLYLRLSQIPEADILPFLAVPTLTEKLRHLTVIWTQISSLQFLRSIPSLESIFLMGLEKPDLEFPTGLPKLTSINLQTRVRSLDFLREYPNLKHLHLILGQSDPIPEMIQDLHHLEDLLLEGQFSQIPPLSPQVSLRSLRLMTDRPLNLEPIKRHMDLLEVNFGRTMALNDKDWDWILSLGKLRVLIAPLEFASHPAVTQLKARGVKFY